eukprot:GHVP01035853.1.p2 GENE.GHVP01035853.1~~GHVP01035853.1.p2  ORF type:complete len:420 (-),score=88.12 GHVP01035853.1:61-1320(-)
MSEGITDTKGNIYEKAAYVLKNVEKGKGKIAAVCLKSKTFKKNKSLFKAVYGLVQETCKNDEILKEVLSKSKLLEKLPEFDQYVLRTAICDILLKKRLRCSGDLKDKISPHKTDLKTIFNELEGSKKSFTVFPTYVRVNTIKKTMKEALNHLKERGYNLVAESVDAKNKLDFFLDKDVRNLLVFPFRIDLSADSMYQEGSLIFQDKASCFPALALRPKENKVVIDACSAPGNKTSHLSSLMGNKGRIYAVEIDPKRVSTLRKMTQAAGTKNTRIIQEDFLKLDPKNPDYRKVKYILIDPSCSSSGIKTSPEYLVWKGRDQKKLQELADMQKKLLLHAFTFPEVERVVYSTCSINEEENEKVVEAVSKQLKKFEVVKILSRWPRRGIDGYPFSELVVRTDSTEDRTGGFFVACFNRKSKK